MATYEETRAEIVSTKKGAAWQAGLELCGYIVYSGISKDYFHKSSNWILQRLHNYRRANGKEYRFKEEEYRVLSEAFRDIAAKLMRAADEIDNAPELE